MKAGTAELIKTERRRSDFGFITEVVQRGRIKPAKYVHSITIPVDLYEEIRDHGWIVPEDYFIDQLAFFEFKHEKAVISFVNLFNCEDLHRRVLTYLVIKYAGSCPVERSGYSKMNLDRRKELVVLMRTKAKKKSA